MHFEKRFTKLIRITKERFAQLNALVENEMNVYLNQIYLNLTQRINSMTKVIFYNSGSKRTYRLTTTLSFNLPLPVDISRTYVPCAIGFRLIFTILTPNTCTFSSL